MNSDNMHCTGNGGDSPAQPPFVSSQAEIRGAQILNAILLLAKHLSPVPETSPGQCNIVLVPDQPVELPLQPDVAPEGKDHGDYDARSAEVVRAKVADSSTRDTSDLTPKEKQEIVDLFDNGRTCSDLMIKFSLSRYSIQQVLRAAGRLKIFRNLYRKRYDLLRLIVLRWLEQGWSVRKILRYAKISRHLVEKVIKDAGLPFKKPLRRSVSIHVAASARSSSKSTVQLDRNVVKMTKLDALLLSSCSNKSKLPEIERQLDQTGHENVPSQKCESELSAGAGFSLDDRKCDKICADTEHAEISQPETEIIKKRGAPTNHKKTEDGEVGFKIGITSEQYSSGQRKKEEERTTCSSISPNRWEETVSAMPVFQSKNATKGFCSEKFQCQICRLSWSEEKKFLLHFAGKEHEQLYTARIFLYCTACQFKSRKPAKMGRHIIKYQSENLRNNANMHSVKSVP